MLASHWRWASRRKQSEGKKEWEKLMKALEVQMTGSSEHSSLITTHTGDSNWRLMVYIRFGQLFEYWKTTAVFKRTFDVNGLFSGLATFEIHKLLLNTLNIEKLNIKSGWKCEFWWCIDRLLKISLTIKITLKYNDNCLDFKPIQPWIIFVYTKVRSFFHQQRFSIPKMLIFSLMAKQNNQTRNTAPTN